MRLTHTLEPALNSTDKDGTTAGHGRGSKTMVPFMEHRLNVCS